MISDPKLEIKEEGLRKTTSNGGGAAYAAARRSAARFALVGEWCGRFRQTLVYIIYTGWDKYVS